MMNEKEFPLVFFTVLSQLAIGLIVFTAYLTLSGTALHSDTCFKVTVSALAVLSIGLTASVFHLGHPFEGYRSLDHLKKSWLSREIAVFGLFSALLFLSAILFYLDRHLAKPFLSLSALVGVCCLHVSGRVYGPVAYPALNNGIPLLFFLITAWILGAGALYFLSPPLACPKILPILTTGLITGGTIHLLVPSVWLSGSITMKESGSRFYGSPIYWVRMAIGFLFPLFILSFPGPPFTSGCFVLILSGELMGRTLFFSHVVHRSHTIGQRSE